MSSLPSVVIVGRPNVGKSTLFNAITGQRRSIVGDEPGITRDRIYGKAEHRGRQFELVDTGGIIPNDEEMIPSQILKQARVALDQAVHIIFLIDGRTEITGVDRDLAKLLRKLGKPVSVAVNKIDSPRREELAHEFYSLGFEHVFPISAEHHLGLDELLDHVTEGIPASEPAGKRGAVEEPSRKSRKDRGRDARLAIGEAGSALEEAEASSAVQTAATAPVKVAIIGRPNVGKSTLLNALAGAERAIVSPIAGTTRDAVDETVSHNGIEYVFVDTAGIRRKGKTKLMAEKLSVVMARRHLRMSNVAVLVLDASEGVLALDATIGGYAHEEGRAIVICVNKWDAAPNPNRRAFTEQIRDELKFLDYASIAFVSAQKRSGTASLFPLIRKAYESASKRVTTGELNRFVESLHWEYDMKIYYMTQAGIRPPTFVVFTDRAGNLHFSAERFLINRLRERFGFEGTPIVIKTKRR